MNYSLTEQDMALISQLPSEIAALAERYPSEILNVADSWNNPSLPDGYIPEFIDVFYGDESVMFVNKGVLSSYTPINTQRNSISTSITVMIDSDFAYIEIEGKEILNKLGGVILPDVTVSASTLIIEIPGVS